MKPRHKTINLDYPIEVDGKDPISQLTMRRLKVGDRIDIDDEGKSDQDREIEMIAMMCDQSTEVICEIDRIADYPKVQKQYLDFLDLGTPTTLDVPLP